MGSIVLDLQKEVTSKNCDILNTLRKAHLIASKLKLTEFDQWISYELNGYSTDEYIPEYRTVRGVLKGLNPYHGWIPVVIPNPELEKAICEKKLCQPISELISLTDSSSNNGLIMILPGDMQQNLDNLLDSHSPLQYALHLSTATVEAIVEKVKNTVLEWTIKLEEEGILGENLRFSDVEITAAQTIPRTVNYYFGDVNVISGVADSMQFVSGDNNVCFDYDAAQAIAKEVRQCIDMEQLSEDDRETTEELMAELDDKINTKKKPGVIKATLIGLKDFLINAGANVAAELIIAKMQGLF